MSLKFPNARLFVYNQLLAGGLNCVQAIFEAAYEFGLISKGKLDGLNVQPLSESCGSAFAARKVLEACFEEHKLHNRYPGKVEEIWDTLKEQIDRHNDTLCKLPAKPSDCSHLAPIVMDLLLQHLRPYL